MRFGVSLPCFGTDVDAAVIADWAHTAEAAGWDGFFLWDHLFAFADGPIDVVDPWIALTAAACATSRIRLGTLVTPLPRRRPVVVARQTVTLDRLSGGRLTLGVGSGAFPFEWDYVGEEGDHRTRGEMLDEHLDLLDRLWTGEPVRHEGRHYRAAGPEWSAICYPPPLQRPRVPVWVGGSWPGTRPFVRAARWDGVVPMRDGPWEVAHTAAVAARMRELRGDLTGFDIAVPGESSGSDAARGELHAAHADAGATWWIEAVHPWRTDLPDRDWVHVARGRLEAGP
ncbi:LLM class flavin-dependent oxidoreductase [Blastococcus sp. PRF04-17]|uniref:LLM class flavin-dependent oxidoreductase n=1 Tax=Blastococcus sp. PRF04-17 TaxID=2933797 RepID=UPI001FF488BB|nr:LLM class flavin-dependent oxidoreductase [Blastococcus sp. PRF04-17]UOY03137.1 LLM class flavin-dependent oxidoreductase [Blastococcus sp. PRF04-17]